MQYKITDSSSGAVFFAKDDESLFAAMIRAGKGPIRYGCAGGGCGVCKVVISQGTFQTFKKMSRAHVSEEEERNGIVLSCCVRASSDLTLKKYEQGDFSKVLNKLL